MRFCGIGLNHFGVMIGPHVLRVCQFSSRIQFETRRFLEVKFPRQEFIGQSENCKRARTDGEWICAVSVVLFVAVEEERFVQLFSAMDMILSDGCFRKHTRWFLISFLHLHLGQKQTPPMGLEPMTTRLKAWRSTD